MMAETLRTKHSGLFHFTPENIFQRHVEELLARLDRFDPDAAFVEFNRITAAVGDAHTFVDRRAGAPNMPLALRRFGEEVRVVGAVKGYERALGTKVAAIGGVPVGEAFARALAIAANDEHLPLREGWATDFLTRGEMVHGLGLSTSSARAVYNLLADDGTTFDLPVEAFPAGAAVEWVSVVQSPPLASGHRGEPFWCANLAEARTVYCVLRRYDKLGSTSRQMLNLLETARPSRLVIDLRQAVIGGDYKVGHANLIEPLRRFPEVNRKGHLFVLTGAMTFSAAMSNAAQFRSETPAILVGRAIGEKPNSWSEVDEKPLGRTGWTLHYSTRFYRFVAEGENIIRPDVEVDPTWADVKAGRDRALEWVLAQP